MTIRKFLNYWFKKKRTGFYLWAGLGTGSLYFAGFSLRSSLSPKLSALLRHLGFAGFLAVILLLFVHLNLHPAHWFLEHFKDTDRLPRRQIALVNSFCMTLFLFLCLIVLPGAAWAMEPVWQAIGAWLAGRTSLEKAVYPALHMETDPMDTPDLSRLLGEAAPAPPWVAMLDQLLRTAASILVALLLILAARALVRRIWRWITRPRQFDSDERIYLTPTWSLLSKETEKTEIRPPFRTRSYSEKIRRQYRKKILLLSRKRKLILSASSSPSELEQTVGLEQPALHQLYEKARYSGQECTREDWEAAKD